MTEALHALTTPGLITELGHGFPLKLKFTTPKDCKNLWIEVHARNHWTVDNKANLPKDKEYLRAIIFGKLAGGKFSRTKIAQYYDYVAPGNHTMTIVMHDDAEPPKTEVIGVPGSPGITFPGVAGEVHYLIIEHDGTESRVPLQRYEPDKRISPFEILIEVFADLGGELATKRLPPVSVNKLSTKRAEVAFIAATAGDFSREIGTASFPAHAAAYWRSRADNQVLKEIYLSKILDTVIAWPATRRNGEPLGVLNIVSHGTETHWWIRKDIETDPKGSDIIGFSAETIRAAFPDKTPGENVLSADSIVVIRACELGNDKLLLGEIREAFNGEPTVYAPRYDIIYAMRDGRPQELLAQIWRFSLRGKHEWPGNASIAITLESEYAADPVDSPAAASRKALYSSFSSDDWSRVAAIDGTDPNGTSMRFPPDSTPIRNTAENLDHSDCYKPDGSQNDVEILKYLFPPATRSVAYELEVTSVAKDPSHPGKFVATGTATRTRFKMVRLLTADERGGGELVTPDLKNARHFGRAP